jgi:hypothetical protein
MIALAALVLACGLGVLSASDARSASALAWYGTAFAAGALAVSLALASPAGILASLVPLAALLLLRHDDRLLLAPLYGACLLLVGELGQRSVELREQAWVGAGVIAPRLLTILAVAAVGGCVAAVAAIAVTIAPGRSVGFTAIGAIAAVAAVALLTRLARTHEHGDREGGQSRDELLDGDEYRP